MSVTAIILSHFKEREKNLRKIVEDLKSASSVPDKIVIICDNPEIELDYSFFKNVEIIRISEAVLPIIRFAIGSIQETTHCLFIDDDLTVGKDTLKQFLLFAKDNPKSILGFEGNINGNYYTDGKSVEKVKEKTEVDVIIRMYFAPIGRLSFATQLRSFYPELPKTSLDDVFLCLGNKYLAGGKNLVIPSTEKSLPIELSSGNVGQCLSPHHYANRNVVCNFLKNRYE